MKVKVMLRTGLLLLGASALSLRADDTDIYLNQHPPEGSEPYVMFSIDWRPSLAATICSDVNNAGCAEAGYFRSIGIGTEQGLPTSGPLTAFDVYRLALKHVFQSLQGVKVGLMISHDQGTGSSCAGLDARTCTNGGYMAFGFRSLQDGDDNGAKAAFDTKLRSIPLPQGSRSHKYQGAELFFEFFRYLTAQGIYNAHNGWTDFGTNGAQNLNVDNPTISWDTNIENGGHTAYVSPLVDADECAKIFTVNIIFGVTQQDGDSDTAVKAALRSGGMGTFNYRTNSRFEDVLRRLNAMDLADGTFGNAGNIDGKQNVTSYFLVPSPSTAENGYANAGGTGQALALSANPAALIATLKSIFTQILSVSTTFVASSVPANVFNRAQIVDNVYIALFQVDANGKPRWPGNLKKLKIGEDATGTPTLVDATGAPAVYSDGRIDFGALTFWTDAGALPPPDTDSGEIAGKDGRFVERGGAGQKIPGFIAGTASVTNGTGSRQLFTEPFSGETPTFPTSNGTTSALMALNADAATARLLQSRFAAANVAEATSLINFARGMDVNNEDNDGSSVDSRRWILADPLHSRPHAINYGARSGYSTTNPDIRILMGTNDGFMHMFQDTTSGGVEIGTETWAFMPLSVMPVVKRLKGNVPGDPAHPYAVDGAPVVYIEDTNQNGTIEPLVTGEKAWLFFGLRRGGRAYYGLDITNPDDPKMMWTISNAVPGFEELGYTFSAPRVGKVSYLGNTGTPALIFGGGYDLDKDERNPITPIVDDNMGNALFVVNAKTGALIWKAKKGGGDPTATIYQHAALNDSIPSDVAAVDTNDDGFLDRVYAGDTGGVLWRADLPVGAERTAWKITPMLSVGRHAAGAGSADDRRFFHRPDVVPSKDGIGAFDGIVIVSGDRPHPLGTTVENWAYMFKDRAITTGGTLPVSPYAASDLADVTDNCLQDASCASPPDLTHGWRLQLESDGEKGLSTPFTLGGTIFFTTYIPPEGDEEGTCGPKEGGGRLYAVALQDATATYELTLGELSVPGDPADLTSLDRMMGLSSGGIPAEIVAVPPDMILLPDLSLKKTNIKTRWRTWWLESEW